MEKIDNIFGTGKHFDIRIKAGAGAFVCGEETALIASLEGERGMVCEYLFNKNSSTK